MNKTSIEWTDYTWNPVTGCHKVSRGCKHCYAETLTNRFAKTWGVKDFREIKLHHDRLSEPKKNKKKWAGKKVFVCSMSDLFQEGVPFEFIHEVFIEMAFTPDTIFQIPTKRPERALEFYKWTKIFSSPLIKNIWIGTSCEDQATANERIPYLLQIPAAVRFLSCEPLISSIDFRLGVLDYIEQRSTKDPSFKHDYVCGKLKYNQFIQWVIAGGESGHGAQPMHPNWVRSLHNQCEAFNIPFFFKQWGQWLPTEKIDGDFVTHHADTPGNGPPLSASKFIQFYTSVAFRKIGKSKAGNLLDGVQHLNFPS